MSAAEFTAESGLGSFWRGSLGHYKPLEPIVLPRNCWLSKKGTAPLRKHDKTDYFTQTRFSKSRPAGQATQGKLIILSWSSIKLIRIQTRPKNLSASVTIVPFRLRLFQWWTCCFATANFKSLLIIINYLKEYYEIFSSSHLSWTDYCLK